MIINGKITGKTENPVFIEYLARTNAKKINSDDLQISGLYIAKNTPFNIEHIINKGTLLVGYNYYNYENGKQEYLNELPSGWVAVFRVKNWWTNTLKCSRTN
jgi:hypothetical protein